MVLKDLILWLEQEDASKAAPIGFNNPILIAGFMLGKVKIA
jgi:hypothetical protein